MQAKLAYTLQEAAKATGLSEATIRRALHTIDPRSFPPPLRGERAGYRFLILDVDLRAWLEQLPDV
ncbi:AlpA family transcriptional regulator [Cellulomonas cellasea]|uniref:Putative DNA-binding transcriptional regulator AlpA n=1 Tax=Cellulomonas cellasea TaxID=43670 RepID=A0A7W4UBQ8_9CELL|nr:hypothetical protein [Cellulomonas cellasea]MBB2921285.1 putative DNA-binding transcriptional regulator AlpA [Cellulomonas cellasea]